MTCILCPLPSDILHIFHLFRLLTNGNKAQIHLPTSLIEDASLQELKKRYRGRDDEDQVAG